MTNLILKSRFTWIFTLHQKNDKPKDKYYKCKCILYLLTRILRTHRKMKTNNGVISLSLINFFNLRH